MDAHAQLHGAVRQPPHLLVRVLCVLPDDVHPAQARRHADHVVARQPTHARHVLQAHAHLRERAADLDGHDRARDAPAPDLAALRAPHAHVVPNHHHLDLLAHRPRLLRPHAEVQHVPRVVHDDNQDAWGVAGQAVRDAGADLLGRGAREDGACNDGGQEAFAHVADVGGLVAGAAAADHGDLGGRGGDGGRVAVEDLVGLVEEEGRVREGLGLEGRDDGVRRVGEEVFRWVARQSPALEGSPGAMWGRAYPTS